MRIIDFDSGSLTLNGTSIRRYNPADLHRASTAIFQQFSRYTGTVIDNVGVGRVEDMPSGADAADEAIRKAIKLAEGDAVVASLPRGLNTVLDAVWYDAVGLASSQGSGSHAGYGGMRSAPGDAELLPHGLSGGEVSISEQYVLKDSSCSNLALVAAHRPGARIHACSPTRSGPASIR